MPNPKKLTIKQEIALNEMKVKPPRPSSKMLNKAMDLLIEQEIKEQNQTLIKNTIKGIKD